MGRGTDDVWLKDKYVSSVTVDKKKRGIRRERERERVKESSRAIKYPVLNR